MILVAHNDRGESYQVIEPVPADAAALLKNGWVGAASPAAQQQAQTYLATVRDRKAWIVCDCVGGQPGPASPVLYPRQAGSRKLSLVRMPDRGLHADACVFSWEEGTLRGRDGTVRRPSPKPSGWLMYESTEEADPPPQPALALAQACDDAPGGAAGGPPEGDDGSDDPDGDSSDLDGIRLTSVRPGAEPLTPGAAALLADLAAGAETPAETPSEPPASSGPAQHKVLIQGDLGTSRDVLSKRLRWLLTTAGLTTLGSRTQPLSVHLARLRAATAVVNIVPDVPLQSVLWTTPDWILNGWAKGALERVAPAWKKGVPLQGYVVVSAQAIEECDIIVAGGSRLRIERPVSLPSGLAPSASEGPWLAIIAVVIADDGHTLRLPRAYAHRRHSHSLVLLDSSHERATLDALSHVAYTTAGRTKGALSLTIEKPLDPLWPEGWADGVRPSFLVHANQQPLIVHTIASGELDAEGRASLARTQALLHKLGPVLIDDRSDPQASAKLTRRVFGWLTARGLLRSPTPAPAAGIALPPSAASVATAASRSGL